MSIKVKAMKADAPIMRSVTVKKNNKTGYVSLSGKAEDIFALVDQLLIDLPGKPTQDEAKEAKQALWLLYRALTNDKKDYEINFKL